jgi:hypothetical protein
LGRHRRTALVSHDPFAGVTYETEASLPDARDWRAVRRWERTSSSPDLRRVKTAQGIFVTEPMIVPSSIRPRRVASATSTHLDSDVPVVASVGEAWPFADRVADRGGTGGRRLPPALACGRLS